MRTLKNNVAKIVFHSVYQIKTFTTFEFETVDTSRSWFKVKIFQISSRYDDFSNKLYPYIPLKKNASSVSGLQDHPWRLGSSPHRWLSSPSYVYIFQLFTSLMSFGRMSYSYELV